MRFSSLAAALSAGLALSAQGAIITQWNFNSVPSDANTSTGTTLPNIGAGTIAVVGGVTSSFSSGDATGGSTDPATGDDSGLQTTTYPAQGTNNKTAGIEARVGTSGYQDIVVSWDQRHSNTSANTIRLQYTLDITSVTPTWVDDAVFTADAGDKWFNNRSSDLSAVTGLNNNPNAAFRVVTEFATATDYVASTSTSNYASTGTQRFDMVTVSGNVIPEPASVSLLVAGGLLVARRRRV